MLSQGRNLWLDMLTKDAKDPPQQTRRRKKGKPHKPFSEMTSFEYMRWQDGQGVI